MGLDYPVTVYLADAQRTGTKSVSRLRIPGQTGESIVVGDLGTIEETREPARYLRVDRKDALRIRLEHNAAPADLGRLKKQFPDLGTEQASFLKEQQSRILVTFGIAIVLLYLFLAAQFESFSEPLILLVSIPVSLSGIGLGLLVAGQSLNAQSVLGILVLFGLVINNAIILRDSMQSASKGGRVDAGIVLTSAVKRIRPILITTMTTLLALLPMAAALFGGSPQQSLAVAVVGGLFSSTVMTLWLIPSLSIIKKR